MICCVMVWIRSSTKLVIVVFTKSVGICCSSMRIVDSDLKTGGSTKAITAQRIKTMKETVKNAFLRLLITPLRSMATLVSSMIRSIKSS